MKVLQVLSEAEERHLSAEEIYRELLKEDDGVGHATVYRVLVHLEDAKIVKRHRFDDEHSVFELMDEPHHDHMVDVDSGEVIEFQNAKIEEIQSEVVAKHGYELVDHHLVLYVRKLDR